MYVYIYICIYIHTIMILDIIIVWVNNIYIYICSYYCTSHYSLYATTGHVKTCFE